jgi:hypothetical protein
MKKLTSTAKLLSLACVILLNCSFINNSKINSFKENVSLKLDCPIHFKIIDENSEPIPGATVILKGSSVGTSSDFDGLGSLTLLTGYNKITVSYPGYETKEITVWCGFNQTIKLISSGN